LSEAGVDSDFDFTSFSDSIANRVTVGQASSEPTTWPLLRLLWRTDENKLYKNTGSVSTPVFEEVEGGFDSAADIVFDGGVRIPANCVLMFELLPHGFDPYTVTQVSGSGAAANGWTANGLEFEVGGAAAIVTATMNDINLFDPTDCFIYMKAKRNAANTDCFFGISNNKSDHSTDEAVVYTDASGATFKRLRTWDAGVATTVNTDVAIDLVITDVLIICSATKQELYLKVAGVWTLKATQSTKLPTQLAQPYVYLAHTSGATTVQINIMDMRIINGS